MVPKKTLWFILISICLNRLCTLFPEGVYFDPFPLYDIVDIRTGQNVGINLQSYIYFITVHLSVICLWVGFILVRWKLSDMFKAFLAIEIFSLLDFFIIYEHPWFPIGSYGVEFTDFKILLYAWQIWKTGRNT
jgi:hypothetical protein